MIKIVFGVTLVFLTLGCPVDLDVYDQACELDEYVKDETCTSCEGGSGNQAGDFLFEGDTQCDYPIEFDLIGNYFSFHAYFDGALIYNGADYTVLETDHDGQYVFLQKDADSSFVQLDWRQTNEGLCLSFTNEKTTLAELPGAESVIFDENLRCAEQAIDGAWQLIEEDIFPWPSTIVDAQNDETYSYKDNSQEHADQLVITDSSGVSDADRVLYAGNVLYRVRDKGNANRYTLIVRRTQSHETFPADPFYRVYWEHDENTKSNSICLMEGDTAWSALSFGECLIWIPANGS